jgi:hypothetical protein
MVAAAQIIDPIAKIKMESSRMALCPQISDSFPQMGVDAALASWYAEPIQT